MYNENSLEFKLLRFLVDKAIGGELMQGKVENILREAGAIGMNDSFATTVTQLTIDGCVMVSGEKIRITETGINAYKNSVAAIPPPPPAPEDPGITELKALFQRIKANQYATNKDFADDVRLALLRLMRVWYNLND